MSVFHYTSGHGIKGIFDNGELHCSNINFMNDPSEKTYFYDLVDQIGKSSAICKKIFTELYYDFYHKVLLNSDGRFVASFSKNADSLAMWNYYSKGNGYNIELDLDSIIELNQSKDEDLSIQKIELNYDKELHLQELKTLLLSFEKEYESFKKLSVDKENAKDKDEFQAIDIKILHILEDFNFKINNLSLSYKHESYKSEEEVRLIASYAIRDLMNTKFKVSPNGVLVEYFPIKLNLITQLKRITLHPLHNELHHLGIKQFAFSKIQTNKIDIVRSEIPFREV